MNEHRKPSHPLRTTHPIVEQPVIVLGSGSTPA
jgi:hypothetical protein